jgi:hypothetical protein
VPMHRALYFVLQNNNIKTRSRKEEEIKRKKLQNNEKLTKI